MSLWLVEKIQRFRPVGANISGKKELSSQIVVHQSNTETSFKQLNNSDRIDNVIEISLV